MFAFLKSLSIAISSAFVAFVGAFHSQPPNTLPLPVIKTEMVATTTNNVNLNASTTKENKNIQPEIQKANLPVAATQVTIPTPPTIKNTTVISTSSSDTRPAVNVGPLLTSYGKLLNTIQFELGTCNDCYQTTFQTSSAAIMTNLQTVINQLTLNTTIPADLADKFSGLLTTYQNNFNDLEKTNFKGTVITYISLNENDLYLPDKDVYTAALLLRYDSLFGTQYRDKFLSEVKTSKDSLEFADYFLFNNN